MKKSKTNSMKNLKGNIFFDMAKGRDYTSIIKIENGHITALKDCTLDNSFSIGPKKKHERITLKEGDKKELN